MFFSSPACTFQEQPEEQTFPVRVSGDTFTSPDGLATYLLLNSVLWLERWRNPSLTGAIPMMAVGFPGLPR